MTVFLVDDVAVAVCAVFVAFLTAAADVVPADRPLPVLRTTVDVLASLDSLAPLALRAVCGAAAAERNAAAAVVLLTVPFRGRVLPVPPAELVVDDARGLRVAAARVERAFSTMELRRVVAAACFAGDTGRAIDGLTGDDGTAAPYSRSRGFSRELDEAGDSTCAGICAA